ncbi:MAG: hypothetical protein ACRCYA_09345 [Cetobacterium sp.]|uniref:hypothetical protein n=1 Tax=Cetobacterium sp. TaxID=2071632 RepID=UPI003F3FC85F
MIDYNLATGQFKVLPNLGVAGRTQEQYKVDMFNLNYIGNSIVRGQTKANLGLDPERLEFRVSYDTSTNMIQGMNALNASDSAFAIAKTGGEGGKNENYLI